MATYTIKRGDSWTRYFILPDRATGEPRVLTDCTAKMQFRHKTTKALLLALDSDPLNGEGGLTINERSVKVEITGAQSSVLTIGTHVFDVEVTFISGEIASTETEYMTVEQDYTYV